MSTAANGTAARVLNACGHFVGRIPVGALAKQAGITRVQLQDALETLIGRGLVIRGTTGYCRLTPEGLAALVEPPDFGPGPKGHWSTDANRSSTRSRLWRALRVMRKGSLVDLLTMASRGIEVNRIDAKDYLNALVRSGHLRRLTHGEPSGVGTPHTRYLLVRDTGPKEPRFNKRKKEVFDPNNGESYVLA